ncbi:META domain-containing protein [Agromyces atrinae]|uniref:META domain-containing protein n=1 Tax=Agromyces atrinae TaxID=592376 RepID=UPI001F571DD0|nr:META domain-containing protein [Agromyces atrinae]MCI2956884.1 META domain-containing protein [Agromyces atrinae]
MNRLIAPLAIAGALLLAGCATSGAGTGGAETGGSPLGTWGEDAKGSPHLEFLEDGTLSGSDGCNGIGGTYTDSDGTITVELGFSTLMACPGVDTWLRDISTASVDGDALAVFDTDGSRIGTLTRAGS